MHKPQRQSSKTKTLLEEESEQCTKISNGRITYVSEQFLPLVLDLMPIQQIGSEIGRGGFGIVFQALNVQTGDFVAVKRFPLKAIEDDSLSSIEVWLFFLSHVMSYTGDVVRNRADAEAKSSQYCEIHRYD